jgi:hypothetical protein
MISGNQTFDWLMGGPAFVRYQTLTELLGRPSTDSDVRAAREAMATDMLVLQLISDVNGWEDQYPITRHNDAVHPLHKLVFAADIGITRGELKPAIDAVLAHQADEGPFQVRIRIPKAFGGDDIPKWEWVATDAPLVMYALLKLGVNSKVVIKGCKPYPFTY